MKLRFVTAAMLLLASAAAQAGNELEYSGDVLLNSSTGQFAPYFIGSLNGGRVVRKNSALLDLGARVRVDRSRRFSWGAGAEVITGYSHANYYDKVKYNSPYWRPVPVGPEYIVTKERNRPAPVWIQQLYGELKYRGVLLRMGQKDPHSALLDESLSSGDLTRSSNARGIPGVSLGFIDFQDIPFTRGWVQIDGVVEYGKFTDNKFMRQQYNYFNWVLATDTYYTYKRCYFRVAPRQPLSVTLGMQTAGQFGGSSAWYSMGTLIREEHRGFRFKDVLKMFLPTQGNGNAFYEGNTLGSWDFKARYRLRDGRELSFAFQWPWEDGSGIGRRNGWDGLWGLYYHEKTGRRAWVTGAAVEYLDFRNQSGPIHWAPGDFPGTTITGSATGGDNYYNNDTYTSYANYGMAIATPFLVSPIYNLDGNPVFENNRARGVHAAVRGCIGPEFDYAVKYSWQQGLGMSRRPSAHTLTDTSMLFAVGWDARRLLPGLRADVKLAFDRGSLRGDNFGAMIGVTYSGSFNLRKGK